MWAVGGSVGHSSTRWERVGNEGSSEADQQGLVWTCDRGLDLPIRASYPRLMEGHQKSFVPPDLCVKVEVLCIFLWWGLMMFIRFFMGFANQKLSTTAVVGPWRTPRREMMVWFNLHLGKLAPVRFWGAQIEAETSLVAPQGWQLAMVRLGRWWNRAAAVVYGRWERKLWQE